MDAMSTAESQHALAHYAQEHSHHRPVYELMLDDVTETHDFVVGSFRVLQDAVSDAGLRAQPGQLLIGDLCREDVCLVGTQCGDELSSSEILESVGVDLETGLLLALVRSERTRVVDRLEARSAREFPDVARRVRHRSAELANQNDLAVIDVPPLLVEDDRGDVRSSLYDLVGLRALLSGDKHLGVQCPEEYEVSLGSDPESPDHAGVLQDVTCQLEVGVPLLEVRRSPDEHRDLTLTVPAEGAITEVADCGLDCVVQRDSRRRTQPLGVVAQVTRLPRVLRSSEHDLAGVLPDAPLDVGGQARKGFAVAGYPRQDDVGEVKVLFLPLDLVGVVHLETGVPLLVRATLGHEDDAIESRLRQELERFDAPGGNAVLGGGRPHQEHRLPPRSGRFLARVHDGHCGAGHIDLLFHVSVILQQGVGMHIIKCLLI